MGFCPKTGCGAMPRPEHLAGQRLRRRPDKCDAGRRRHKLHITRFRRCRRRKLAHSAVPPLPAETASLGFGGISGFHDTAGWPFFRPGWAKEALVDNHSPPWGCERTQRLTGANTGAFHPLRDSVTAVTANLLLGLSHFYCHCRHYRHPQGREEYFASPASAQLQGGCRAHSAQRNNG